MALLKTLLGAAALSAPVIAEAKTMHVSNLHSWLAAHASGSSSRKTMSVSGSSSHSGSGGMMHDTVPQCLFEQFCSRLQDAAVWNIEI